MLQFEVEYFKVQRYHTRDLLGSQIPMTIGKFELRLSYIRSSYLIHWVIRPKRLGGFGVPEFATTRQDQLINVEIPDITSLYARDSQFKPSFGNWNL